MAVALIYGGSGSGKTVNSTRVAIKERNRNLLLCSDNSHIVLRNFDRPNLDIAVIKNYLPIENGDDGFVKNFESNVNSKKYDNIITDNLTDLFDMAILEMDESGVYKDPRQGYQMVYHTLKRLVRKATQVDCDIIFTAWQITEDFTLPDGRIIQRTRPHLPMKILDNILGLCNVVAHVETLERDGETVWYYNYNGNAGLYAKDQLFIRKNGLPEDIFRGGKQ